MYGDVFSESGWSMKTPVPSREILGVALGKHFWVSLAARTRNTARIHQLTAGFPSSDRGGLPYTIIESNNTYMPHLPTTQVSSTLSALRPSTVALIDTYFLSQTGQGCLPFTA
jgi:hypothetical protein